MRAPDGLDSKRAEQLLESIGTSRVSGFIIRRAISKKGCYG